jgi:hypothetical protein
MWRWIFLLAAFSLFLVVLNTAADPDSVALFGWSLVGSIVFALAAGAGFIAARVDGVSSGQGSREIELLMVNRGKPAAPRAAPARPAPPRGGAAGTEGE